MLESAQHLGVEVLLETKAAELIVEDGRVVGVKAEGKASSVRANAVILATGGFGNTILVNAQAKDSWMKPSSMRLRPKR